MVISGHNTLSEVDRYTKDVDRRRLVHIGLAKRVGQSMNTEAETWLPRVGKPMGKSLKIKRLRFF